MNDLRTNVFIFSFGYERNEELFWSNGIKENRNPILMIGFLF